MGQAFRIAAIAYVALLGVCAIILGIGLAGLCAAIRAKEKGPDS
jgi:hypothetical protein